MDLILGLIAVFLLLSGFPLPMVLPLGLIWAIAKGISHGMSNEEIEVVAEVRPRPTYRRRRRRLF
jgi:hypothetical protein